MPDYNQESENISETDENDDRNSYDQWQSELDQEKRMAVEEQAEQEKEKAQGSVGGLASSAAGNLLKKQIKKSFWKLALRFLIPAAPYIILGLLILGLIGVLYYFISNPCEAARYIGEWWATAVGEFCKVVGK